MQLIHQGYRGAAFLVWLNMDLFLWILAIAGGLSLGSFIASL